MTELSPQLEADLLDLIEGVELTGERRRAVEQVLRERPALARRVRAMAADRRAVQSLGHERAPVGLVARAVATAVAEIEAEREAEALRALAEPSGEASVHELRVSSIQPGRASVLAVVGRAVGSRWARPVAVAAMLALGVGGLWIIAGSMFSGRGGQGTGPVLMADGGTAGPAGEWGVGGGSMGGGPTGDARLAGASAPGSSWDDGSVREGASDGAMAVGPAEQPTSAEAAAQRAAAALAARRARLERELVHAAPALEEGRVVIRLRSLQPSATLDRIEGLTGVPAAGSALPRVVRVPESGVSAVTAAVIGHDTGQRLSRLSRPEGDPSGPWATGVGGVGGVGRAGGADGLREIADLEPAMELSSRVYSARIEPTRQALASLAGLLSAGPEVEVFIDVMARPVPVQSPADLGSILWWTGSSSGWSRRIDLPIVVQTR
jgi:anti-sigma factor RsiW